ncbi:hypothetical protein PoB_004820600 [Plakobranchus ocellatus]|uniref:Uncharacterized protein n=1 Tax=Plakobranchus ocellatus TaxID=259542 RepID=A0AAV4BEE3_9GAST|nr:hypothetical protein PoB_004820600 [Plakobranchus ocellatus]
MEGEATAESITEIQWRYERTKVCSPNVRIIREFLAMEYPCSGRRLPIQEPALWQGHNSRVRLIQQKVQFSDYFNSRPRMFYWITVSIATNIFVIWKATLTLAPRPLIFSIIDWILVSGIYDAFDLLKRVLVPSSNILLGTYKTLNRRILLQEAGELVTINSTMRLHCRHPQWSSCRLKQGLSSGRHAPIITEMSESPGLLLLSRSQR